MISPPRHGDPEKGPSDDFSMTPSSLYSSLYEFAKHFLRVNGNEGTTAAGEDFPLLVRDFGHVNVPAPVDADFPALDPQRRVKRHGLDVFNGHFFGQGDDLTELVYLAHGIVENAGDDASVAVARRARIPVAQIEIANEAAVLFIEREDKAHPLGVIGSADEAGVARKFDCFSVVAMGLAGHGTDSSGFHFLRHHLRG